MTNRQQRLVPDVMPWQETPADNPQDEYRVELTYRYACTRTTGRIIIMSERDDGWELRIVNKSRHGGHGLWQRINGLSRADAEAAALANLTDEGWDEWKELAAEQKRERLSD